MSSNPTLLGNNALFVKNIDIPTSISDADLTSFVETTAEDSAPLPPDKLRFSYARNGKNAIFFAGAEDRIFQGISSKELEESPLVIPSAALAFHIKTPDGLFFFEAQESLALIESGKGKWKNFYALPIQDIKSTATQLLEIAEYPQANPPILKLGNCTTTASKINFEISQYANISERVKEENPESSKYSISKKELQKSDIRDKRAIKKFDANKRKQRLQTIAIATIPLLFILMLLWQISQYNTEKKLSAIEAELAISEPQAKLVEAKVEEIAKMNQFTKTQALPMEVLALLNAKRADPITFQRVSIEDKSIEIRGIAKSILEAQTYHDALKSDKNIESLSMKTETSKNGAKFTLSVNLK